ncbi:NADH-quinone oxidoreductase subunit L [Flaviflexus huanghaiensis]|uniref:NADH-quinone oxidoreductase subunit 5 family protein n=1 Tax=Flaviflexus huanghaiensis TaxID=1111473 RepID=UPI0015F9070A|nr:proton-conducting transporter membrane subunit [Flaviflexus huanghaiensis]
MSQIALALLVLLPAGVGSVLAVSRGERAVVAVSLATATVTALLAVVVAVDQPRIGYPFVAGTSFALGVDGLAALMVPTIAIVALLVLVFASSEIRAARGRFYGFMLIFVSAGLITATAETIPTLLFAWEIMGATSYALIGFWWRDKDRVSAGMTAFLTTRTADLGLYVAAGAALASGAGLSLDNLTAGSSGWRHVMAAGFLLAALGKAAQLPFSYWISRAMEGPSAVSALLHSAAMVALGGYLLLRVQPLLAATGWAGMTAAWIGAATAVLLGLVALAQRDLKQLLAASTSAQLGFIVLAAGVGGVTGGATHLIGHAATKAALFLAAGIWLTTVGSKRLADLRGVARRWRITGLAATTSALSLAGIAPLALWATKDAILGAALDVSPALYATGLAAAMLSAAYAGKILRIIWQAEAKPETVAPSASAQAPLVVLAVGAAGLGMIALPPLSATVAGLLGEPLISPTAWELTLSAAVAVVILALVWWRGTPEPRWLGNWLGLGTATHLLVVNPNLRLAERLAQFDERGIDRAITETAAGTLRSSDGLARFDDHGLSRGISGVATTTVRAAHVSAFADDHGFDGVVRGVATGFRRLGRYAREPQTGQLHHYYIASIAVFAVGVLLLVFVR